jgi:hypothetical protein
MLIVMAGLCPGHPRLVCCSKEDVDARIRGHDGDALKLKVAT